MCLYARGGLMPGDIFTVRRQVDADELTRGPQECARVLTDGECALLPVGAEVITMREWRKQPRGTILHITDSKGDFQPRPTHSHGSSATRSELLALIALPKMHPAEPKLREAEARMEGLQRDIREVRQELAEARRELEKRP